MEGPPVKGRPVKNCVDRMQLEYLKSLRFTWSQIASLLGISSRTIQRRAKQWDVKTFSSISDIQLDEVVSTVLQQFPKCGEVLMCGHLRSLKVSSVLLHGNTVLAQGASMEKWHTLLVED